MDKLRRIYFKAKDNQKILKMIAVIMIIIAAVLIFEAKGNSDTISLEEAEKTNKSSVEAQKTETDMVYIDIGGEVKSPGVYKVAKNSRIFEVIEKAGGLTKKADTSTINQAESVKDGQKIQIPSKQVSETSLKGSSGAFDFPNTASSNVININTADSTALQEIPGVGPVTADKIIAYRNENGSFHRKEDIKNVSGIGDKTYEKIKNKITV